MIAIGRLYRVRAIGHILRRRQEAAVNRAIASAYRFSRYDKCHSISCIAFEGLSLTSDVAEKLGDSVDLVIGFGFTAKKGAKMIVSLRSHTDFDCAAFAKEHGGGGHTRAAGFSVSLTEHEHPYALIEELVLTGAR